MFGCAYDVRIVLTAPILIAWRLVLFPTEIAEQSGVPLGDISAEIARAACRHTRIQRSGIFDSRCIKRTQSVFRALREHGNRAVVILDVQHELVCRVVVLRIHKHFLHAVLLRLQGIKTLIGITLVADVYVCNALIADNQVRPSAKPHVAASDVRRQTIRHNLPRVGDNNRIAYRCLGNTSIRRIFCQNRIWAEIIVLRVFIFYFVVSNIIQRKRARVCRIIVRLLCFNITANRVHVLGNGKFSVYRRNGNAIFYDTLMLCIIVENVDV